MEKVLIISLENSENGSLLLDVPLHFIQIPAWLGVLSKTLGYKPKEEYHVTVIGLDLADLIQNSGKANEVASLIDGYSWTFEASNKYIELAKDDENNVHRQSIICPVEVPELTQFYEELTSILDINVIRPPTHVTLCTKNYDRGIGLYSESDLRKFKVRDLTENTKAV